MKKFLVWLMCVALTIPMIACGTKEAEGVPQFGDNSFRITNFVSPHGEMTYKGITYPNAITVEQYATMKESGIDTVLALWSDAMPVSDSTSGDFEKSNTKLALDAAQANGMKYLVMDLMFRQMGRTVKVADSKLAKIADRLQLYKNHPAFGGIHLDDEPSANYFESIEKVRAKIAEEIGEDKDIFLNIFGSRAGSSQMSGSTSKKMTYVEYVDEFVRLTNFKRLSYDNYPFYYNALDENIDTKMWFENLELAAARASLTRPLSICIQSCDMDPSKGVAEDYTKTNYYAQIRSEQDISFQLYTGMAYGVKEFTYFTYWTPNDPEIVKGMMTLDGKKTDLYDYVKNANAEIRLLEKAFLSFDYVRTMPIAKTGEDLSNFLNMLTISTSPNATFESNEEVVIGEFQNSTKHRAYMIANATEPRFNKTATVSLTLNKKINKAIVIINGVQSTVDVSKGKLSIDVSNGSGVLVMPYVA